MIKTEVNGNWNEQRGKLKQKFAILTGNDLMFKRRQERRVVWKTSNQAWQNNRRIAQYYRSVLDFYFL